MADLGRLLLKQWKLTSLFVAFAVAYILQTLLVAPAKTTLTKYQIGASEVHLLQLTVILPYIIIWIIGLVGYLRMYDYAVSLQTSKDGRAFRTISKGILWFVLWLPIAVFISSIGNGIFHDRPDLTDDVIIVQNYANLLLLVPAFWYMYRGAEQLVRTLPRLIPTVSRRSTLAYIAFASVYTSIVLEDSARRVAAAPGSPASYYLPDWLIIFTIIVPRLVMWYLGLSAVQYIRQYRRKVAGVIYSRALKKLAFGFAVLLLMVVLLRITTSLTHQISHWSLGLVLLMVYALLTGMAVGYILIAKGARQLQTIEEA
jgi:hypothetical protein